MSQIFINYRRADSAPYAGRLYDRLAKHFGNDSIFMDIDHIDPGEDFNEVIQKTLNTVQIAIILIGKNWLDLTDATGERRLDNPDDLVRLEIAAVLERKIRAIPVLVGGAVVPKSSQLPVVLSSLVRRNAYEISDTRFHYDVDILIKALEKVLNKDGRGVTNNQEKAIDINPKNDSAWLNMGIAYGQQGNHVKAIESYQKSIDINPNNDSAFGNMGWFFLKLGMFEEALDALLKAWEYSKHKLEAAPMNLGHVFLLQKNQKKAMEWYQTSLELWRNREAFFYGLKSDFSDLNMERYGISQQDYDRILEELKCLTGKQLR